MQDEQETLEVMTQIETGRQSWNLNTITSGLTIDFLFDKDLHGVDSNDYSNSAFTFYLKQKYMTFNLFKFKAPMEHNGSSPLQ